MAPQGAAHGLYVEMRLNARKATNVNFSPFKNFSLFYGGSPLFFTTGGSKMQQKLLCFRTFN